MGYRCNERLYFKDGVSSKEILVNRIALVRKSRGMSQTDLGRFVGLTKASISKIETGASGTTAFVACKICKVLGCKFEDLFTII